MPLFQPSVQKKYLADLPQDKLHLAWEQFIAHFHDPEIQRHILDSKEEEYQEGFVRDLFGTVLGYTIKPKPDYNLVLEKKSTSDSTKSDGAILSSSGAVIAVIELKDTTTTDLDRVVKQAFHYKHQHKECRYVIISNFQYLRLYISDSIDYVFFDLFRLTKESFALMYCCLQQAALQSDVPLKMKQQSVAEEENVTKKLYADYDRFRKQLFGNIKVLNPQYNRLDLFKKTQKLLDRFLFILFAEDRLLLPPNSVREILKQWEALRDMDQYVPLYDRFRKYFGYMNTGYQGKQFEIFAYNGGLFTQDEILDNITIDDQLLYDSCMGLSNYDFESEVDVNILGHIFEHSLTEIERIEQELANEAEAIEDPEVKYNTKRKKDGVFYTPRYITKYIVENTVGALCTKKWEEFKINPEDYNAKKSKTEKQKLLQTLDDYRQWLLELTICDPACGSGAFLNQALEFLIAEHHRVDVLKARLFGTDMIMSDVATGILENNLYGVDINEEATDIAKLSLWLRTAKKGRKLNSLNSHIKCGNSLIDDPAVAGDKAFNWQMEFPEVFAKGGFDVVIGNPPYGAAFKEDEKLYLANYKTYKYRFESYVYFFELGINILNPSGYLGYITPELWLSLENCHPLRLFISQFANLVELNLVGENIFNDAVVNTVITILSKEKNGNSFVIDNNGNRWVQTYATWERTKLLAIEYRINISFGEIIKKIEKQSNSLNTYGDVIQGITPYDKYRGQDPDLIKRRGYHFQEKMDDTCGKWLNGEDINRYKLSWSGEWLKYGEWLAAPREKRFFEGPRLLFREIPGKGRRIQAAFAEEVAYYGHSITPFILESSHELNVLKVILAIVNSKLISWYGNLKLPNFGKEVFPKLNPQDIKLLPIHNDASFYVSSLIEKVDLLQRIIVNLDEQRNKLLGLIRTNYVGIKISKKLQDWPDLSFGEFVKELKKLKTKFLLSEQSEWMQYFEAEKAKANAIQDQIDKTDKAIDAMVYELYGLTEEEIRIVEDN